MHPIWFAKWLWERSWSADGLLPLLERNQGALSLAALTLALGAFLVENRRAHDAQAEAQTAEDRAAAAARAAEADRRQYEFELQRQEAAANREADIDQRLARMATFTRTANGLILGVDKTIVDDLNAAVAATTRGEKVLFPSEETRKSALVAAGGLMAIIPAAPLDADLITTVRRVAFELEIMGSDKAGVLHGQAAVDWLREQKDKLTGFAQDIGEHNIILTALLRPAVIQHVSLELDIFDQPVLAEDPPLASGT